MRAESERTSRPATAAELTTLRQRGSGAGGIGCAAPALLIVVAIAVPLRYRYGYAFGIRIELRGDYIAPVDLGQHVDLTPLNDQSSHVLDGTPDDLPEIVQRLQKNKAVK